MTKRRRWTDELVIEEIKRIYSNEEPLSPRYINRNYGGLYRQAYNRFGSWRQAVELVTSLDYEDVLTCKRWTKDLVVEAIKERIDNGLSLTAGVLVNEDKRLHDASCTHFGSWRNAVTAAGFNYDIVLDEGNLRRSKKCTKYTVDDVKSFICERYAQGKRLSSGYISSEFRHMAHAAQYRFGGWKEAITYAGVPYEDVREDESANLAGHLFEDLLGNLFNDLCISYTKYEHEKWRPDFILSKEHWIDAKLSEWTSSIPTTIQNYEPHVRRLTIVYMRGRNHACSLSDKTEIVSVYQLLEYLNEERRSYYLERIQEIENKINTSEIGSHSHKETA
ncbi:hypothetical protein D0U04_13795 [Bacillus clarus]|uniref:Uncharacterized protein n=1 Tax=Bacillus clarus TaxID=2338372 RepID=A0A090YWP0_9BACI|nr:hypothetical protein [Bacillus clarus]KFN02737.1 hypothetical protein DJ93_358 [Bacillus clarus]RFT66515.1 hypothetical protein D0U04_13795 [Bacillus clarus]